MPHTLPPLDALQAVFSASTLGSFSAAAEELNVTHGAISRRVTQVEQWAGMRIFERHGRGVRLTLNGQRLIAQIEQALSLIEDVRLIRHQADDLDIVRIGVVQSFARLWLIPHLSELEGTPPDLRVEPEIDHRNMTLSDVRIGIRLGRGDWPDVVARRLFTEMLIPCASPELARQITANGSVAKLLDFPLIHDGSDANWRYWLSQNGLEYERRSRDRIFPGYDLAMLAASQGHGIVLARDPYGVAFRMKLGLQPVAHSGVLNPQAFHLVTQPKRRHPSVERLANRIMRLAAEQALV